MRTLLATAALLALWALIIYVLMGFVNGEYSDIAGAFDWLLRQARNVVGFVARLAPWNPTLVSVGASPGVPFAV